MRILIKPTRYALPLIRIQAGYVKRNSGGYRDRLVVLGQPLRGRGGIYASLNQIREGEAQLRATANRGLICFYGPDGGSLLLDQVLHLQEVDVTTFPVEEPPVLGESPVLKLIETVTMSDTTPILTEMPAPPSPTADEKDLMALVDAAVNAPVEAPPVEPAPTPIVEPVIGPEPAVEVAPPAPEPTPEPPPEVEHPREGVKSQVHEGLKGSHLKAICEVLSIKAPSKKADMVKAIHAAFDRGADISPEDIDSLAG